MGNYSTTLSHVMVLMLMFMYGKSSAQSQGPPCMGLNNVAGACVALKNCEPLITLLRGNLKNADLIQRIKSSSVQCNVRRSEVCCPGLSATPIVTSPPESTQGLELPTFEDRCGSLDKPPSVKKIIGGSEPKIGTWPWIAVLGYISDDEMEFRCGGTIISKRHVLTAAHCITPSLSIVRLGEHDLTKDTETRHVDIKIRTPLRHPSFSRTENAGRSDIGLLYLDQDVQFTDKIKPICLPITPELRAQNYEGFNPFIAGWGRFSTKSFKASPVLLQTQIRVFSNLQCENQMRNAGNLKEGERIDDAFICAGDAGDKIRDACAGDSGGPLVGTKRIEGRFHSVLIGIVSSGLGCARENTPGLYANTSYFMNWIEENVKKSF